MGHGIHAALLATLLVASLRNSRRGSASVIEQTSTANAVLNGHSSDDRFVTG